MLAVMKKKTRDICSLGIEGSEKGPMPPLSPDAAPEAKVQATPQKMSSDLNDTILKKIKVLRPKRISIVQNQENVNKPSITVSITADCFEGLESSKRELLVKNVIRKETKEAVITLLLYSTSESSIE